jgi:hypothetical protein
MRQIADGPIATMFMDRPNSMQDEQHAASLAVLLDLLPITVRRHDDAAGALHRLRDQRRERPCRLRVDHVEADLDAGAVASIAAMADRAAIGVRDGERERARHHRSVTLAPGEIIDRLRSGGHAVPGAGEADHFKLAGVHLGELERGLVGLPSVERNIAFD